MGPDFERPAASLPSSYAYADGVGETDPAAMDAWWLTFDDPVLAELVDIAQRENLDLRIAASPNDLTRLPVISDERKATTICRAPARYNDFVINNQR